MHEQYRKRKTASRRPCPYEMNSDERFQDIGEAQTRKLDERIEALICSLASKGQ